MIVDDFGRAATSTITNGTLWQTIYHQYMNWTGRITAEIPAYLLFNKDYEWLSLTAINVLNSFALTAFYVLGFKIVSNDKGKLLSKESIVYSFFFFFVFLYSGFIGNAIWKTVAIQYFWGILLLTYFVYKVFTQNKEPIFLAIFTGLFIGLYNEIYFGVCFVLCLAYFIERFFTKKRINKSIAYFFIACTVGGIILAIAPGNYKRLDVLSGGRSISLVQNIYYMYILLIYHPYTHLLKILILLSIFLMFISRKFKLLSCIVYALALVTALFVLTPVVGQYGGFNERVLMIYYALFTFIMLYYLFNSNNQIVCKMEKMFERVSYILVVMIMFQMFLLTQTYYSLFKFDNYRLALIERFHQENIKDVKLPLNLQYYLDNNYRLVYFDDITNNPNDWRNKGFANYYRFDSVKAVMPPQH